MSAPNTLGELLAAIATEGRMVQERADLVRRVERQRPLDKLERQMLPAIFGQAAERLRALAAGLEDAT